MLLSAIGAISAVFGGLLYKKVKQNNEVTQNKNIYYCKIGNVYKHVAFSRRTLVPDGSNFGECRWRQITEAPTNN